MRAGLVIYGALDSVSGGYLYDRQLVAHLRAAGDTVKIFSLPWRNYARHLTDNFSKTLSRHIARAQLDILIEDELNHPSLLRLNRQFRDTPYPIVSLVHHLRCYEKHPRLLNWLYRRIERTYLQNVDAFILNSNTTRRAVCDALKTNHLTHSIVAPPAGDHLTPHIFLREILARTRKPAPLQIVFVGNLIPRKGAHTLLDALAQLPREDFNLTIIGSRTLDPSYTRQLDAKIRAQNLCNVKFTGALSDGELERVLRTSHVLAVPSEYEGFGIAYLEAQSFGLPALGTTAGAAREIIADGKNGFLVAPHDARALAEKINLLSQNPTLLTTMSLNARAFFLRQPGWAERMAQVRDALLEWKTLRQ